MHLLDGPSNFALSPGLDCTWRDPRFSPVFRPAEAKHCQSSTLNWSVVQSYWTVVNSLHSKSLSNAVRGIKAVGCPKVRMRRRTAYLEVRHVTAVCLS